MKVSTFCSQMYPQVDIFRHSSNYCMILFLISLSVSLIVYYFFIHYFAAHFYARVREYTPESHQRKNGTPSMGGIIIMSVTILALLLTVGCTSYSLLLSGCLFGFGMIGGWDDWNKLKKHKGISARLKFTLQLIAAFVIAFLLFSHASFCSSVYIPFFKVSYQLGGLFIPWAMFILISCSNAVNLTDGLDGLAIISLLFNFVAYSYIAIHQFCSPSLFDVSSMTSILSLIAALVGSGSAFLWYNAYPATVMMGDVGALSLGAVLALLALITKQELLLPLTGIVFVAETVSVMVQVWFFRLYNYRFFKRAPLHHHFELSGWAEQKVVTGFSLITVLGCMLALWICMR